MKPITLTDLDGVYFQSRRECPINLELSAAALDEDRVPSSFMTPKQSKFLEWLLSESHVIPVTARTVESFKRVLVSFDGYAICSFGGVILTPEGTPEPRWHEQIQIESSFCSGMLFELKQTVEQVSLQQGTAISATVVTDAGCHLYLNCKHDGGDSRKLDATKRLLESLLPSDWQLHVNGNNLAVLPPFLGKDRAAYFYLSELAPSHSCVLGVGDSLTDVSFMALCDYAVTPTNSQVFSFLNRLRQGIGVTP